MDTLGSSALKAPTTQLARECRIHIAYRRSALNHIKSGGQITPDIHMELMAKAEAFVPALKVISKSPQSIKTAPYSLFHSAMLYEDGLGANSVKSHDTTLPSPAPELTIIAPEIVDPTAQPLRDAEPPFVPVLRLFRAQVVVTRLELCA